MSLCESIFLKGIYELSIEDLISYFDNEQEETSVLEFKSGDVGLESIYREIAAFLNTEGGLLIIGSPKEKTITTVSGTKKVCQGALTTSKIQSQDNLLRSIASNISPAPYGIKAKEFDYQNGKVYLLEIAQSVTPPHQVSNEGKYYIRLEREAKSAPHGIVEALFYKRQKPLLDVDVRVYTLKDNYISTFLDFTIKNESLVTAEHIGIEIKIKGVERLIDSKSTTGKIEVNDNTIKYKEVLPHILVRGLAVTFEFEIVATTKIILVQFSYWCKDSRAELIIGTFEIEVGEFTKRYSSKDLDISQDAISEIYNYFEAKSKI
jgi:hypothetical protein